jgi:hypothetical protein
MYYAWCEFCVPFAIPCNARLELQFCIPCKRSHAEGTHYLFLYGLFAPPFVGTCPQAAFDDLSMGYWAVAYLLDGIFLGNTATELFELRRSTVLNESGVGVDDNESRTNKKIQVAVDVISLLPLELVAMLWFTDSWAHTMALLRVNRLLRVVKISTFINLWGAQLHTNAMRVHSVKFIVMITLMAHWQTCVWFSLACREDRCVYDSWVGLQYNNATAASSDGVGFRNEPL